MRAIDLYRFCPRCGKQTIAADTDKSVHCHLCDFLLFTNVAAAVGALITDPQGRILLLRRSRDPRKGKLGAPGGFIDAGESVETALRREVLEEVNLHIDTMQYLTSYPNSYEYRGITYPTADLFFICTVKSLAPLKPLDEVESILFLHPHKIDPEEIAFPSLREALRLYAGTPRLRS